MSAGQAVVRLRSGGNHRRLGFDGFPRRQRLRAALAQPAHPQGVSAGHLEALQEGAADSRRWD